MKSDFNEVVASLRKIAFFSAGDEPDFKLSKVVQADFGRVWCLVGRHGEIAAATRLGDGTVAVHTTVPNLVAKLRLVNAIGDL